MRKERLEYLPAHFAVQFAHAIHAAAALQSKIGHVEGFRSVSRVLPSHRKQILNRNAQFVQCIVAEI